MISFTLAVDSHAERCRAQLRELRRDNGLCEDCGNSRHLGKCRERLSYYDRKSVGLCTYPGCDEACCETSVQCRAHASEATRRVQRHREETGRTSAVRG